MHQSVPRLVDGVHIADPDVDEMVKCSIVEGHVVGMTIKLVLVECNETTVIDEVVHRQPLLQDITEVLLQVLQMIQGGIDNLKPVTMMLTRRSVSRNHTSLVVG